MDPTKNDKPDMSFLLSPDLRVSYQMAMEIARRFNHRFIGPCDLLLGLYYGGEDEASRLLRAAVTDQTRLDAAVLAEHGAVVEEEAMLERSTSMFLNAAALAFHCRGAIQTGQVVVSSADLAVALLEDDCIRRTLKAAGLDDFKLKHLEAALRFQEKLPPSAVSSGSHANPRLQ